ncbi:MAG: DUF5611 family protein [Methanocellales archaeon]|nr:DUF5611 family protein [Methanocellales archaeon]
MVHIQVYTFKKGYSAEKKRILAVLKECFPCEIRDDGGKLTLSYGAIKEMVVWVNGKLHVDIKPNLNVSDDVIIDTNKCFRDFLEKATGYTAKQRVSMAKKKCKND